MNLEELKKPLTELEMAEMLDAAQQVMTPKATQMLRRLMFEVEGLRSTRNAVPAQPTFKAMSENNDKRCMANQIILDLHAANEFGQIQLLYMACRLALKSLDPALYHRCVEEEHAVLALEHTTPDTLRQRVADLETALTQIATDPAVSSLQSNPALNPRHIAIAALTRTPDANGRLHGYCVVCGVPWPCETAQKFQGHDYIPREEHERVKAELADIKDRWPREYEQQSEADAVALERVVRERDEALVAVSQKQHGASGLCCQLRLRAVADRDSARAVLRQCVEAIDLVVKACSHSSIDLVIGKSSAALLPAALTAARAELDRATPLTNADKHAAATAASRDAYYRAFATAPDAQSGATP